MIFLDIFRESPNLLRRKNAINFVNYLVKKMILLVPFLVISLVDHFFGEFICQFLAKKSVKVLLQYLISSIQCEEMNISKKNCLFSYPLILVVNPLLAVYLFLLVVRYVHISKKQCQRSQIHRRRHECGRACNFSQSTVCLFTCLTIYIHQFHIL